MGQKGFPSNTVDFEAAVRFSPAGIVIADSTLPDCPIVFINNAFTRITGYTAEEAMGKNCRFLQGALTSAEPVIAVREALGAGVPIQVKLLNYRKSGETFWNELRISPQVDKDGAVTGFIAILTDITEAHRLEDERTEMEARLASIVANMPGYIFQRSLKADGSLGITYFSPSFAAIIGVLPGDERKISDLWPYIHPDDRALMRDSISESAANLTPLALEFRLRTPAGEDRWVRNHSTPRRTAAGDVVWDGVGLDITAEKVAEDRLSYLAYHDPLTGMANRELFGVALDKAMSATIAQQEQLALFKVDLDAFEEINDAIGRFAGDMVLRGIAKRIADFADRHNGMAARIGGDEFALFYSSPKADSTLQTVAQELRRTLAVPHFTAHGEYVVEASIGIAAYPLQRVTEKLEFSEELSELMKRATLALQSAKRTGRGMYRIYSSDGDDRQRNQIILRNSLRKAIEEEQFRLHYHPLVDLVSGEIVGAEALVRWNHPDLGLQRPDIFIPFAESSGLIVPLGAWVFQEAMRQVKSWQGRGIRVPKISINVSGVQLQDPGLLQSIDTALACTGTKAEQFELELTESFMIEVSSPTLQILRSLKMMGFSLAVDDFGTGHSSFRYLRDFPVDKVKIDQTFVRQLVIDSSDASIIRAIIALAKSLELDVVAEGIETTVQRDFLREEGCQIGQGYLFSLPLTGEDFGYLIDRRITLPFTVSDSTSV